VLSFKIEDLNIKNDTIRINIRGDKTKVGQQQNYFNCCFTLLDELDAGKIFSF